MFKFRECSPAGVLSHAVRRRFTKASNADFQLTKLRISFFITYYLVKDFTDDAVFSVKNPLSPVFPLPPNDFFEPPHTIRSLFAIRSLLRGGWLGVGWGLPGGCLGVPRGPSLPTPRQPPGNPHWNPSDQWMGCIHIQELLRRDDLQKPKQTGRDEEQTEVFIL